MKKVWYFCILCLLIACDRPEGTPENEMKRKAIPSAIVEKPVPASNPKSWVFAYQGRSPKEIEYLIIPANENEPPEFYGVQGKIEDGTINYFAVRLLNISEDETHTMNFNIRERELFSKPVRDINHTEKATFIGKDKSPLHLKAQKVKGGMMVFCQSAGNNCLADTMFFRKIQ